MRTFPLGRLGNNLFQIAYIKALSKRTGDKWCLPSWNYIDYFNMLWNIDEGGKTHIIKEKNFDYHAEFMYFKNASIEGYFQSEKYFNDVWDEIKDEFKFRKEYLYSILDKTDFRPDKKCWAVHIRLTDFVGNKFHAQIPLSYYTDLFIKNPKNEYYIFTDDYKTCYNNFSGYSNVQFVDGCSDIEHLVLMSQFQNIIIANSSFSWWGAKLAELYHKTNVIRPDCLFTGELAGSCVGEDFYPDRWIKKPVYKKINKKTCVDLSDVTFVIPINYDHDDRIRNINYVIEYIKSNFNTHIIVGEHKFRYFEYLQCSVEYVRFENQFFYRTKMINDLVKLAKTSIVFVWDADVFTSVNQILDSVKKLKEGYDIVYPYDGRFINITDTENLPEKSDINNSVGGAYGFRKESFIKAGMENENFESFGFEDNERWSRFNKLGLKIYRAKGIMYHIKHFRGKYSNGMNAKILINRNEYNKVNSMSVSQLKQYISTWNHLKNNLN